MTKHLLHLITIFAAGALVLSACKDTKEDPGPVPVDPDPEEESGGYLHDKMREKPYPKLENELFINPAPLVVPQAMKTSALLRFELSRDAAFPAGSTTTSEAVAWNMFNPHRILETGRWYWRFRSESALGTAGEWSEPYPFDVKGATPQFVTPAVDAFLTNLPTAHPRLFCFVDSGLAAARATITSHVEYKKLTSRASTALTANYGSGNIYEKAADINNHMLWLYTAYHLTQNTTYRDRMLLVLRQMLATNLTDKVYFSDNFVATNIAAPILMVYDIAYDQLTPAERGSVEQILARGLRKFYPQYIGTLENHIFENHTWQINMRVWFWSALMLHDKAGYTSEVRPMLEYFYELWTARAPATGFNRDGIWVNGTGYVDTNVITLFYMPMIYGYLTGADFLKHPWYQNGGKAFLYALPPDSHSAGFGDGSELDASPTRSRLSLVDMLARETGDAYAGWYATQCAVTVQDDYNLRLYRIARGGYDYPNKTLPSNTPKYVWHKDVGEVYMHSDISNTANNLSAGFRSSVFGSGSHTLADQNSFNLLYKGQNVYMHSGYYLNFSDPHNLLSYRHTRAHNTILVNGMGQPFSTKGYGVVTRAMGGNTITYCLGDASDAYCGLSDDQMWIDNFKAAGVAQDASTGFGKTPLTLYRRHFAMLHPDKMVIYDELEASQPAKWEWLLHSPTKFTIDAANRKLTTSNATAGFTACTQLFTSQSSVTLSQTDQFFSPPTPELYGKGTAADFPNQWHMTADLGTSAKARVLAVIQLTTGTPVSVYEINGTLFCGEWEIKAELDASKPAALSVVNSGKNAVLSYNNESTQVLYNNSYHTRQKGSTLLWDVIDGTGQAVEQTDYKPISSRKAE